MSQGGTKGPVRRHVSSYATPLIIGHQYAQRADRGQFLNQKFNIGERPERLEPLLKEFFLLGRLSRLVLDQRAIRSRQIVTLAIGARVLHVGQDMPSRKKTEV